VEMLETVLMRAFLMLYVSDFVTGDGDRDDSRDLRLYDGKTRDAECGAFRVLSSVCSDWHMTLVGWPQSPTSQWVRHQLRKLIERE